MSDLLVENHVDSVGLDVNCVISHELQNILDARCIGQTSQADTVTNATGCW